MPIPSQVNTGSADSRENCKVDTCVKSQACAMIKRSICSLPMAGKLSLPLMLMVGDDGFSHRAETVGGTTVVGSTTRRVSIERIAVR